MYGQVDNFKLPNLPLNQTFLRRLDEKYRQPLRSCLHEISNIFQYNVKIHADTSMLYLCYCSNDESYMSLEPVWFQSCVQHRFENSIWFENLELMTILLFNQSDCGSTNCTFRFRCKNVMKYFMYTKNICNGREISNRFDFSLSLM